MVVECLRQFAPVSDGDGASGEEAGRAFSLLQRGAALLRRHDVKANSCGGIPEPVLHIQQDDVAPGIISPSENESEDIEDVVAESTTRRSKPKATRKRDRKRAARDRKRKLTTEAVCFTSSSPRGRATNTTVDVVGPTPFLINLGEILSPTIEEMQRPHGRCEQRSVFTFLCDSPLMCVDVGGGANHKPSHAEDLVFLADVGELEESLHFNTWTEDPPSLSTIQGAAFALGAVERVVTLKKTEPTSSASAEVASDCEMSVLDTSEDEEEPSHDQANRDLLHQGGIQLRCHSGGPDLREGAPEFDPVRQSVEMRRLSQCLRGGGQVCFNELALIIRSAAEEVVDSMFARALRHRRHTASNTATSGVEARLLLIGHTLNTPPNYIHIFTHLVNKCS